MGQASMCSAYGSAINRSVSFTILFGRVAIEATEFPSPLNRKECLSEQQWTGDAEDVFKRTLEGTIEDNAMLADIIVSSTSLKRKTTGELVAARVSCQQKRRGI